MTTYPDTRVPFQVEAAAPSLFRRDDAELDLSDEIRLHLEMETEDRFAKAAPN